jgi:FMN phosphatase YigB (HAD superfamily)
MKEGVTMQASQDVSFLNGANELRPLLENAAAISFDFFDTLFVRPLTNPEDAFDILAQRFAIPDFRQRRRAAQAEAFRRMQIAGRNEIRLDEIYACLMDAGRPSDELMRAEYALELALIEPNPEVIDLFRVLLHSGKPVVITSDMYFSADFFIQALQPYGLANVPLFISADRNATKRDRGELFDEVIAQLGLPARHILHIGDNLLADVTRPRQKGLMAFHYRDGREQLVKKTASLATSIGNGLLRTQARDIPLDSFAALGFLYGGAATVGFLEWIRERARLDGVDHVLFLSRDGYALDRIARAQAESGLPDFCYFLGSRTAYTLASITADNFIQSLPFLLSGAQGLAPCELLERIGVQPPSTLIMEEAGVGGRGAHQLRIASKTLQLPVCLPLGNPQGLPTKSSCAVLLSPTGRDCSRKQGGLGGCGLEWNHPRGVRTGGSSVNGYSSLRLLLLSRRHTRAFSSRENTMYGRDGELRRCLCCDRGTHL